MRLLLTDGLSISGLPVGFTGFSPTFLLGLPTLFWMVVIVAIPAFLLLHMSRWGRYVYAVGSNLEAAPLAGINTRATLFLVYVHVLDLRGADSIPRDDAPRLPPLIPRSRPTPQAVPAAASSMPG